MSWHHSNWARAKQLAGYGGYAFVNLGGESLRSYTDAAVIARVLTIALVTPFNIATRLMDYFQLVISAIASPLLTAMSEIAGQSSGDLTEFFLSSTKYTALISAFIASLFLLEGKALIRLWVGPAFLTSYPIVLILTAGYVVVSLRPISVVYGQRLCARTASRAGISHAGGRISESSAKHSLGSQIWVNWSRTGNHDSIADQ